MVQIIIVLKITLEIRTQITDSPDQELSIKDPRKQAILAAM